MGHGAFLEVPQVQEEGLRDSGGGQALVPKGKVGSSDDKGVHNTLISGVPTLPQRGWGVKDVSEVITRCQVHRLLRSCIQQRAL